MSVRVGILGFAHGHVGVYCREWRAHPELGVTLVAGWDRDGARLAQSAAEHALAPEDSADALLARRDVDAVVIGAETSFHADLAERAAAAGKAIVVQKPLALTLPEADRIVDAVERAGVPCTVAWQMRVDPHNLETKALLEGGALGKVFMVRRRHGLNMHMWPNYTTLWHVQPELNRDMWADDAAHAIDYLHWLLGVPESVTAEIDTLGDPRVPMDNGIAIYRYPGGPIAEVCCSFTCPAAENTVEVIAERGSIVLNYGDVPSANVPRPPDAPGLKWYTVEAQDWTYSETPSPPAHGARIAGLAAPLAEFLQGKRPPIATAAEGRTSLRMTLACHLSTQEGRRVRLDDPAIDSL
ncbi:MAG: Gfo/Idh/MocA family oxidoreductase [Chloroflexi bacterium]|nr:Gfo/Idh/MocA family oxidoreductase [Chloroflexota bacterium]